MDDDVVMERGIDTPLLGVFEVFELLQAKILFLSFLNVSILLFYLIQM